MNTETWLPVVGYDGLYSVSNMGNVISNRRGVLMSLSKHSLGYILVGLRNNGVQRSEKVHRLVAMAFIPNPENKPQVNHINGVKHDNKVENLEWATRSENRQHAVRTKLHIYKRGNDSPNRVPVFQYCIKSGLLIKEHLSLVEAAKSVSGLSGNIWNVLNGRNYQSYNCLWSYRKHLKHPKFIPNYSRYKKSTSDKKPIQPKRIEP